MRDFTEDLLSTNQWYLTPRPKFDLFGLYAAGDSVAYDGKEYEAVIPNRGNVPGPFEGLYWSLQEVKI